MTLTVRDVMTPNVVETRPNAPFKEIVRIMQDHGVSALPVVDADGRIAGVVSEADLLLKEDLGSAPEEHLFQRRGHRIEHRKAAGRVAEELMTAPAITVASDASLHKAAALMHSERIKRLPVVDRGHLNGIVSRKDLLTAFLTADAEIGEQVRTDVLDRRFSIPPYSVDVAVRMGVVSLAGTVERRMLADDIVAEVRTIDGVVGVDSSLGWDLDDLAPVLQAYGRVGPW